jgi:hypothetical protein
MSLQYRADVNEERQADSAGDDEPRVAYEVEGPDGSRIIEDLDELTEEMFRQAFPDAPPDAMYREKEYTLGNPEENRSLIVIQEVIPGDDPDKRREVTFESMGRTSAEGSDAVAPEPYYDVAVSFAGEQRAYVEEVVRHLQDEGIKVFYDKDEQVRLWGMDLVEELASTYPDRAFRTLMFVSKEYAQKVWPYQERRAAQARAVEEMNKPYILPVLMDDTALPGLHDTTGRMDGRKMTPAELGTMVVDHLREHGRDVGPPLAQRDMAQRVGVRAVPSKTDDGKWEVAYSVHNGGDYPINTLLLAVNDPGQDGRPEDQMGTAVEVVMGSINAGEISQGRTHVHFKAEPSFGELTYMAAVLFSDHWGNHWATKGGEVMRRPYPARVC